MWRLECEGSVQEMYREQRLCSHRCSFTVCSVSGVSEMRVPR